MIRQFTLLLTMALLVGITVFAQGAPDQINIALERLSGVVNRNLTLNDLEDWRWSQDLYNDTSLGCPQPDTAYAQVATQGFTFLLTYEGVVYDYRVSGDGNTAFLCSQTSLEEQAEATPTPVDPEAIDTAVICPEPEPGVIYTPSRMTADIQARVAPGLSATLQDQPGDAGGAQADMIGESIFAVEAGPVCADGRLWWQVNYDGAVGWVAETQATEEGTQVYTLESIPGLALPSGLPVISVANAAEVTELSRVENSITPALDSAPSTPTIAVMGGPGTHGVWLYNLAALNTQPALLSGEAPLTSVDYGPDGALLLLGDGRGGIRLWSANPTAELVERWFDKGHENLTTAVAFSPNGQTIASAGDVAVTGATDQKANAILLWDVESVSQRFALAGHSGQVNALSFSPDGALLASASEDNSVRLWNPADGSAVATLSGHTAAVNALAFSPDGTTLASADSSGMILLWDVAQRSQTGTLQMDAAPVGFPIYALAFNNDGTVLASAGDENDGTSYIIRLWDVAGEQTLAQVAGHSDVVRDLAFSADGTLLVSTGDDKSIRFAGAGAAG